MLLEDRYKEKYDEGVAETNQHRIEHYFRKGYSLEEAFNFFDDLPADTVKAVWESFKQSQEDNASLTEVSSMLLEERYKEKYDEGVAWGVVKGAAENTRLRIEQLFQNGFSVEDVAKLFVDIPADAIQAVWESFIQSQEDNA